MLFSSYRMKQSRVYPCPSISNRAIEQMRGEEVHVYREQTSRTRAQSGGRSKRGTAGECLDVDVGRRDWFQQKEREPQDSGAAPRSRIPRASALFSFHFSFLLSESVGGKDEVKRGGVGPQNPARTLLPGGVGAPNLLLATLFWLPRAQFHAMPLFRVHTTLHHVHFPSAKSRSHRLARTASAGRKKKRTPRLAMSYTRSRRP